MRAEGSASFAVTSPPAASAEAAEARTATSYRLSRSARLRAHWPLGAILTVFALSMLIVPTLADVTISDDWVYMRSVRILVEEHKLEVHPLVSSHLVFQVLWGGLFGSVFGVTAGVMRLSIVVLWLLSGVAFYCLVWDLTARRALSALGTAIYLFNPLGYVLAFTFMTDAPFTALLVISTYCTVRGLRGGISDGWIIASAAAAACALLVRQPGVFIPVGVLAALVLTRRLWFNPRSLVVAIEVGALPLLAYAGYYWWLHNINGVPVTQTLMQSQLLDGGWNAFTTQTERLAAIEAVYIGLFVLPLTLGAAIGIRRLVLSLSTRAWVSIVIWQTFVIAGFAALRALDMHMPYIPHFMSGAGLGPNDLIFARGPLAGEWLSSLLTLLCATSAVGVGFLLIRAFDADRRIGPGIAVVLAALACQAVAAVLVSTHFRFWMIGGVPSPSLDRYLLPLLPLALAAVLWAVRNVEIHLPLAWYVTAVLAVFAVVGTRDNIVFHQANWDLARTAVASGIPLTKLDAGGSWTGFYLGERSYSEVGIVPTYDGRWWLSLYGSVIDPEYVISAAELPGYTTISAHPYSLWLDTRPTTLYLLHRDEPPQPP